MGTKCAASSFPDFPHPARFRPHITFGTIKMRMLDMNIFLISLLVGLFPGSYRSRHLPQIVSVPLHPGIRGAAFLRVKRLAAVCVCVCVCQGWAHFVWIMMEEVDANLLHGCMLSSCPCFTSCCACCLALACWCLLHLTPKYGKVQLKTNICTAA